MADEGVFRDDADRSRFLLEVEGGAAEAKYNLVAGGLMITEVRVPPALEGRGLASRIAARVTGTARERGLLILPVCPFMAGWLRKHPEHAALVHPDYRAALGL